ncbi:MAG: heme A synthase [Paracoccaceae bacterium]
MNGKHRIFEDVGAGTPPPQAARPAGRASAAGGNAIRLWLVVLFVLVAAMTVVGGLTRLTDSGLSITEWRPVTGALPPMGRDAWAAEFAKYQAIPEYRIEKHGMTLAQFKFIYWWEWSHRQFGRVIGLVWAAGFLWFLLRRRIPPGWTARMVGIGLLGGLQGAIGWWMVSSGLGGAMLDVAPYRLATHLGIAFLILGLIAWYIFLLGRNAVTLIQSRRRRERDLFALSGWLVGGAFLQILLGALVAGTDAGRSYVDWPLMAGEILPPESFELRPLIRNAFENPALVQFDHRIVGYALFFLGVFVWARSRRSALLSVRRQFGRMMLVLGAQAVLGIATVLYAAPLTIAIIHQIVAIALFALILRARFESGYPGAQSVHG